MTLVHLSTRANDKKHRLTILNQISEIDLDGRHYCLLNVIAGGNHYLCLRLYNKNRHFIKQMLFETEIAAWLIKALT